MRRLLLALAALAALAGLVGCDPAVAVPTWPTPTASVPLPNSVGPIPDSTVHCHAVDGRADVACTPGVRNPNVTQANIATTVCRTGWTDTIRPPASYTTALKRQQMPAYGLAGLPTDTVEEDHLLALEIGGNPTDPGNLWPQLWGGKRGAHAKDLEENSLHKAVCAGRLTLAAAQARMLRDWTHA